jgi:hypothetical protein
MKKQDLKLISSFIGEKNGKTELAFAKVEYGAIIATDTRKVIKFNVKDLMGKGLIHKKLLKAFESIVYKDEIIRFEDNNFIASDVRFNIDTGYFVEDEDGKHKLGAKYEDYPAVDTVFKMSVPYHFTIESIEDLQFELAQKNCFIDDIHLNPIISYSNCSMFDIYYMPQRVEENGDIETATVKIVAQKADDDGVVFTQFIAVIMGRKFESKAKEVY